MNSLSSFMFSKGYSENCIKKFKEWNERSSIVRLVSCKQRYSLVYYGCIMDVITMAVELPKEKWIGKIGEITIGATADEGGTRTSTVTIGGAATLPALSFEGSIGRKPVVAMEVLDLVGEDYPEAVKEVFGDVINNPASWAKACVENGADLICLRLVGTNPEEENRSVEEGADTLKSVLKAVGVPIIVYGSGHEEKDPKLMEAISEAGKGERLLLGHAEEEQYKSLAVACMSNSHAIIAFSNLDINLAKQINILLTDFDFPLKDIVMDPLWAGLGYGLEYAYSIVERIRLAGLMGDKTIQNPILCDISQVWNARETQDEDAAMGSAKERGVFWETVTAVSALTAGADLLVMRHPEAVTLAKEYIDNLWGAGSEGGDA